MGNNMENEMDKNMENEMIAGITWWFYAQLPWACLVASHHLEVYTDCASYSTHDPTGTLKPRLANR